MHRSPSAIHIVHNAYLSLFKISDLVSQLVSQISVNPFHFCYALCHLLQIKYILFVGENTDSTSNIKNAPNNSNKSGKAFWQEPVFTQAWEKGA